MVKKEQNIHQEIKKLMNIIARYARSSRSKNGKSSITRSQALTLEFIYDKTKDGGNVYQKDIEKQFSIRRSTATESLKRLETQGWIKRETSTKDARLKDIVLTEKALYFVDKNLNELTDISKIMCKGISKEELLTMKSVLLKMQNNLKENSIINEKNI